MKNHSEFKLFAVSVAAVLLALAAPAAKADPGPAPACDRPYIQAHLAQVEAELLAADISHLAPAQRARRAELIVALGRYRTRCVFPTHDLAADRLVTVFVDEDGVHCAVGHLMALTGAGDVVARIRATANTATVQELAHDSAFRAWLEAHGLTAAEAARIQPSYCAENLGGTCLCGHPGLPRATGVAEARITALPQDASRVEARVTRVHGTGAAVDEVRMVHRVAGDVVGRDILIVIRDGDVPDMAWPWGRGANVVGDGHVSCASAERDDLYYCAHVPTDVYVAALQSEDCLSALGAHDPDLQRSVCDLDGAPCRADGKPRKFGLRWRANRWDVGRGRATARDGDGLWPRVERHAMLTGMGPATPVAFGPQSAPGPLPYLAWGDGGGIVLLKQMPIDFPDMPPEASRDDFDHAEWDVARSVWALQTWLGDHRIETAGITTGQTVTSVVYTAHSGVLETVMAMPWVGRRFEVFDGKGDLPCVVQVVRPVRAALCQVETEPYPPTWTFRCRPGAPGPEKHAEATARDVGEGGRKCDVGAMTPFGCSVRWVGFETRSVGPGCLHDGLTGTMGTFDYARGRDATAVDLDAVRGLFRRQSAVVAAEGEYARDIKAFGANAIGCSDAVPPNHLDEVPGRFRGKVFEGSGQPAFLLAEVGTDNLCDPGQMGISFVKSGAGWSAAGVVFNGTGDKLAETIAVRDRKSGGVWLGGPRRYWPHPLWAFDVVGLEGGARRARWGEVQEPRGHVCNYDVTHWEFAEVCTDVGLDEAPGEDPANR